MVSLGEEGVALEVVLELHGLAQQGELLDPEILSFLADGVLEVLEPFESHGHPLGLQESPLGGCFDEDGLDVIHLLLVQRRLLLLHPLLLLLHLHVQHRQRHVLLAERVPFYLLRYFEMGVRPL